jgi:hypothetical protein
MSVFGASFDVSVLGASLPAGGGAVSPSTGGVHPMSTKEKTEAMASTPISFFISNLLMVMLSLGLGS